jgi:hypothetical protein
MLMSKQGDRDRDKTNLMPSPKDLLVIVPVLGSVVALSYEVGRFLPVGTDMFGVFPLADHLAFAGGAIPLALLATLIVVGATAFRESFPRVPPQIALTLALVIVVILFLAPLAYDDYWRMFPESPVLALGCMFGGAFLVIALLGADLSLPRDQMVAGCLLVAGTISVASAAGAQASYYALGKNAPPEEITTPAGKHVLRVLVGNATALIGVDNFGRVVVIKGDQVKQRIWVSHRLSAQAADDSAPKP